MRPMVLEFQNDLVCAFLDKQYMIGDKVLVAPVFDKSGCVDFYLPEGVWVSPDEKDRRAVTSGMFFREKRGYLEIPVYIREQ